MNTLGPRRRLALKAPGAWLLGASLPATPALAATANSRPKKALKASTSPYASRADVLDFAQTLAQSRGLDEQWLRRSLAQARPQEAVRRLMMPTAAGTAKNWAAYRDRFIEPNRIQAGLVFWKLAQPWLIKAQAQWGVPAALVVAIVGVETFYGRHTGGFRVIDSLATLSFDFPTGRKDRSGFFRAELEEFFVWCQREQCDPTAPLGSYAGAMGLPQFMPSSLNRYAIDFDGSGRIDLARSVPDVVGSVAHYFAQHGWQPGTPTHFGVEPPTEPGALAQLREPDIKPSFTAAQLADAGATLEAAGQQHQGLLALVELQNGANAAATYVAGTDNFYAVTRYNWSAYYAMAVIGLAQGLEAAKT